MKDITDIINWDIHYPNFLSHLFERLIQNDKFENNKSKILVTAKQYFELNSFPQVINNPMRILVGDYEILIEIKK